MGYTHGSFSQGTGPIVLTNVQCIGVEQRLLECPNTALSLSCSHSQDAGVTCQSGKSSTTEVVGKISGCIE